MRLVNGGSAGGGGGGTVTASSIRAALAGDPTIATDVAALLLQRVITVKSALPGHAMFVDNVEPTEGDPYPIPVDFEAPVVLEDVIAGKHTVPLLGVSFVADVTDGPTLIDAAELATNTHTLDGYSFPASGAKRMFRKFGVPLSVEAGTFTVSIGFQTEGSTTDAVVFAVSALAVGAGDALNGALGTAVLITHTCLTGSPVQQITVESAAITPAGAWQKGDHLLLCVERLPADAGDTYAGAAVVQEVNVHFTTDQITDAAVEP